MLSDRMRYTNMVALISDLFEEIDDLFGWKLCNWGNMLPNLMISFFSVDVVIRCLF